MAKPLIAYHETFAALGKWITHRNLRDVCLMEFEGGMIVTGSLFFDKGESSGRTIETTVFSFDELRRLAKEH